MLKFKNLIYIIIFCLLLYSTTFAEDDGLLEIPSSSTLGSFRLSYIPNSRPIKDNSFISSLSITQTNFWSHYHINGNEIFNFDSEITQYIFQISVGVSPNFEVGLYLRLFWQGGGFLDALIEDFHDTFNFGQMGRTFVPRNNFRIYDFRYGEFNTEEGINLNDLILSKRLQIISSILYFRSDIRIPIKSPISGYGIQSILESKLISEYFNFYLTLGLSLHQGNQFQFYKLNDLEFFSTIGFKFKFDQFNSFIFQLNFKTSTYPKDNFILTGVSWEWILGFKIYLSDEFNLQFAIIENETQDNLPDVGFNLKLTFIY